MGTQCSAEQNNRKIQLFITRPFILIFEATWEAQEKGLLTLVLTQHSPLHHLVTKPEELFVYLCSELWFRDLAEK